MYIKVKVTPGAKKEEIKKKGEDTYVISVRQKAERNMANDRIREIIASIFGVSVKNTRIVSGHQSPSKILNVDLPKNRADV
jgi:uncharacterized protein YggU (UPF0235/DUF167 family)